MKQIRLFFLFIFKYIFNSSLLVILKNLFPPTIFYGDVLIEGKVNGFYVEAGALDGELHSNTLFFELNRNFSGMIYSFETSK